MSRRRRLAHRGDTFPGKGLGQLDGVAGGLTDVHVMQKPVKRSRDHEGFWHEFVEAGRVQVRRHRDGSPLVGGIDEWIWALIVRRHDRVSTGFCTQYA